MTSKLLLSLDLSTTCTGWALFCINTKQLLEYGNIRPKVKNVSKLKYPKQQLYKMQNISLQIVDLILQYEDIVTIIIEEVNRHKNRLTGKTLDGLHYILLDKLSDTHLNIVKYMDSDGLRGWRTKLNIRLTHTDKENNKEIVKLNKKLKKRLLKITKKHITARFVNKEYKLQFDVNKDKTDADIVDAIGLGTAYLRYGVK